MKKLEVRFRNKEDLKLFEKKIKILLSVNTLEVNMITKDYEYQIKFLFSEDVSLEYLNDLFEQNISEATKSIWFPKYERLKSLYRFIGGRLPKYPIYIVSKNRAKNERWHTSFALSQMCLNHYIVVEPDEFEIYSKEFKNTYATILELDLKYKEEYDCFSDLGNKNSTGPGAARNFCWDHSIKNGFEYHWVLDDNIREFYRYYRGRKLNCRSGEVFRTCEEFVERYENVLISGMNYESFCHRYSKRPPYIINTRIYSLLLIKNDIPYRWRGRYNEDTDLSLRVLKDGFCTIQFNIFLGDKAATQKIEGGNTEEFYANEGTFNKSKMLVDMHPDVSKMMIRWDRDHHYVDYSVFKQKLKLKEDIKINKNNKINENGMMLIEIPENVYGTEFDTRIYLEENYKDFVIVDENLFLNEYGYNKSNINDLF